VLPTVSVAALPIQHTNKLLLCIALYSLFLYVTVQTVAELTTAFEQQAAARVVAAELQLNATVKAAEVARKELTDIFTAANSKLSAAVSAKDTEVQALHTTIRTIHTMHTYCMITRTCLMHI
jgi:hypothetical protein